MICNQISREVHLQIIKKVIISNPMLNRKLILIIQKWIIRIKMRKIIDIVRVHKLNLFEIILILHSIMSTIANTLTFPQINLLKMRLSNLMKKKVLHIPLLLWSKNQWENHQWIIMSSMKLIVKWKIIYSIRFNLQSNSICTRTPVRHSLILFFKILPSIK